MTDRPAFSAGLPLLIATLLALPAGAWAQTQLQPATVVQAAGQPVDPPGQVARLNLIDGQLSFAAAESDPAAGWSAAQANRPLTAGDRLWSGERARSELHIGSSAVRMDEKTSLDFLALDDDLTQLRLAQGTLNIRVRALYEGQRFEIDTPNLAFVVTQPGEYRLDVDPAGNTTRVVVFAGGGQVYGDNGRPFALGNRQQSTFTGTQLAQVALPGSALADTFDAWAADRNRQEDQSVSARYIPREVPGYQQLDNYGDWSQDPSYGAVWIPRAVPAGWAPYRAGQWSWIAPWGWTWIDDAPWGFAPFHYGRWAQLGPRWAWVPGRLAPRPAYAPALVAFVGGSNWNLAIGQGGPRPGLGWFPLAPGEAWRPSFRASPRYLTRVNNNIVINNNVTNIYRYQRAPGAVTAVSTSDFVRGRPVRGNAAALTAGQLADVRVVDGGRDLPRRPDPREQSARPPAGALPPAAVTTRPVVGLHDGRNNRPGDERRNDREGRPDRDKRPAPAAPAISVNPQPSPAATAPVMQDNNDIDRRARREQERRQQAQPRPADFPQTGDPSLGQRALAEQAAARRQQEQQLRQQQAEQRRQSDESRQAEQRQRSDDARKQAQEQRSRQDQERQQADQQRRQQDDSRRQAEQQQRAQREQAQRQQQEQARQQAAQRQQNEEALGQRALREQAEAQQRAAREQGEARRTQERQQRAPQATSPGSAEESLGARAQREQRQKRETP